eukprot:m.811537 g.811537  ORF g.811537 m.811537 type:complete len:65 (+) comp59335_c0_seq13:1160-1354(+)
MSAVISYFFFSLQIFSLTDTMSMASSLIFPLSPCDFISLVWWNVFAARNWIVHMRDVLESLGDC